MLNGVIFAPGKYRAEYNSWLPSPKTSNLLAYTYLLAFFYWNYSIYFGFLEKNIVPGLPRFYELSTTGKSDYKSGVFVTAQARANG